MKKIARYISIMMIAVLLTGCEETSSTIQSTISDSAEVNQVEPATSNVTSSVEANKTVEKSEIETQVAQTEIIKEDNQGNESSSDDNTEEPQADEHISEEPAVIEPTYEEIVMGEVKEESVITFGRYEQDNNLENGPEPIEWYVFKLDDEKATLLPVKCLMCAKGIDTDARIEEFASTAFNEEEQKLLVSNPKLITEDMIAGRTALIEKTSNSDWYMQDNAFAFFKNYTEKAVEEGARVLYVHQNGYPVDFYHYIIWTDEHAVSWSDATDGNNKIITMPQIDRKTSSYYTYYGLCPYIEIYTDKR